MTDEAHGASNDARSPLARWRVLYLVAIAAGVFVVKSPLLLGALVASQAALWLAVGLGAKRLARQVWKLWAFAALILVSYALTGEDANVDRWSKVAVLGAHVSINVGGLVAGGVMLLRVLAIILGSQVARAGDPRAIAAGLASFGAPKSFAAGLDAVLVLLGGEEDDASAVRPGSGRGGGRGGGGGRGRGGGRGGGGGGGGRHGHVDDGAPREGLLAAAKRIARGDVAPIRDRIERHIVRAEAHLAKTGGSRDAAVVAGLALTMLGIKALKILPNVPFAPGHKLVLLTPLYIAASMMTKSRFGATWTGLTMGVCAFLLGDGKYGVFEIVKHVTPGLVCDLLVPFFAGRERPAGRLAWSFVGALSGATRFATIFVVTLAVQPPAVAFAFLVPGMLIHTTFGAISGYVSQPLVALLAPLHQKRAAVDQASTDSTSSTETRIKETA